MDLNAEGDHASGLVRCWSQSSLDECSQERPSANNASGAEAPAEGEHAQRILSELSWLRRERLLTDVTLRAGESAKEVPAHRAVLAACSPYFRAMFTQFDERTRDQITIQDVDPCALEAIIDYAYDPSSLRISEENVQCLLSGASLLAVSGVRSACCAFMARRLSAENALGIRAFALAHGCGELADAAHSFALDRFEDVCMSEEFLALELAPAAELLQGDELRCGEGGERVALDAALRWAAAAEGRERQLGALLRHVRLPLLPREELVRRAREPPLLEAPSDVKDLLIEALSYHLVRAAPSLEVRARPRRPRSPPRLLLVAGGQAPKAVRAVEALVGGAWSSRAPLPSRRCRAGLAALAEDRVLVVGGFNGGVRVRTVDVYDATRDCWSAGPSMNARRSTLGVAVLDGGVYAVGGFDGVSGLASAEWLPPGSSEWRSLPDMSCRRSSVGVAALDGAVYAVGGYDGAARACLSSVESYRPSVGRWQAAPEMAARRSGAGVAALGGALYAVGGHDGPAVRRSVELLRLGAGAWTAAPPMLRARRNAGCSGCGGKLFVVGGDDGHANLDTAEVFDPETQTWTELSERMALGRSYAAVCVLQRQIAPPAETP